MSIKLALYKQKSSYFPEQILLNSGVKTKLFTQPPSSEDLEGFSKLLLIINREEDFSFLDTFRGSLKISIIFEDSSLSSSGNHLYEEIIYKINPHIDKIFFLSISALKQFNAKFKDLEALYLPWPVYPLDYSEHSSVSLEPIDELSGSSSSDGVLNISLSSSPRIEWRAHKLLEAICNIKDEGEDFDYRINWLIEKSEFLEAKKLLEEFRISNYRLYDSRSLLAWTRLIKSSDVCFHNHFSAFNTPSIFLYLSLASGKKVLASTVFDGEYLPSSSNLLEKIKPGFLEVKSIISVLKNTSKEKKFLIKDLEEDINLNNYIKEVHDKKNLQQYLMSQLS